MNCDLCGLPARSDVFSATFGDREYHYCCAGCRMVFAMLMEAADAPDPSRFKQTDLYRRCVTAGVVPAAEEDLNTVALSADMPTDNRDHARGLPLDDRVEGMWCPACAWVIGAALKRVSGVEVVECDFSTDRLRCRYDPIHTSPEQIRDVVKQLGYRIASKDSAAAEHALRRDFVRLAVSALLSANVMMLSWALYSGFFTILSAEGVGYISWPVFVMATAVILYGGGPIMRKAWFGIRHGAPGMEALIVLGAGSAYLYSLVNWWSGSLHLYFDTATMLITLLLLGKMLESQAKSRVRADLEGFLALQPNKVRLWNPTLPHGRYVAVEQLSAGDCYEVGPEDVLPADGRVLQGNGRLDASAITGEPRPVTVMVGDAVVSGSRVRSGDMIIQADRVGADSLLGQMIAIVKESLVQKTDLESRTDRLLIWFVPLISGLALATGLSGYAWGLSMDQALVRAVTVLVIACPCALGIAIPLVRVAGISGAGRRGILVKDFRAFEQASRINSVVLDKTGTVTHGRWTVERFEVSGKCSQKEVIALAMGLEKAVDHTIARSIEALGRQLGLEAEPVEDIQLHAEGVSGHHQSRLIKIGRRSFAVDGPAAKETPVRPQDDDAVLSLSEVVLSVDGKIWAQFYFGDTLRKDIVYTIQRYKTRGLELHLVSGDEVPATEAVSAALGIDHAMGRLMPGDKADYIGRLQEKGRCVAMLGDGINDAPALTRADMGVAMHSGSPLAQQAAGVTLMRGDPSQLLDFFDWAVQVDRKVRQNLWCALGYNVISIPVAMAGLLSPLVAVTAMLLSSLTVIGNTLLLVRKK